MEKLPEDPQEKLARNLRQFESLMQKGVELYRSAEYNKYGDGLKAYAAVAELQADKGFDTLNLTLARIIEALVALDIPGVSMNPAKMKDVHVLPDASPPRLEDMR